MSAWMAWVGAVVAPVLSRRWLVGGAASLVIHLAILALAYYVGGPGPLPAVKRGEPLFVELPETPEPAPAGNPSARSFGRPDPPTARPSATVRAAARSGGAAPRSAASPVPPAPEPPALAARPAPPKAEPVPPPQAEPARVPEPARTVESPRAPELPRPAEPPAPPRPVVPPAATPEAPPAVATPPAAPEPAPPVASRAPTPDRATPPEPPAVASRTTPPEPPPPPRPAEPPLANRPPDPPAPGPVVAARPPSPPAPAREPVPVPRPPEPPAPPREASRPTTADPPVDSRPVASAPSAASSRTAAGPPSPGSAMARLAAPSPRAAGGADQGSGAAPGPPGALRSGPQVAALAPAPTEPPPVDIRSALRRGAGAGGRGGGRGGITGEPVPLDSSDPRFGDYLERVRRAIQDKMVFPPCVRDPVTRRCELLDARLVLVFGILKNGQLQFADVVASSGPPVYDEYSERAIRLAAPFPPVPPAIMASLPAGSTGMPIRATFVYTVQTSIFSVIR